MAGSYYHWCCEGLRHDLLFKNTSEYVAGMNRIGVCYLKSLSQDKPVSILAFCLMSNHFHFVLHGEEEHTGLFVSNYILLTGKWISRHRQEKLHESISPGHWMAYNPDKLREKIIYNLRQAVEAGIAVTPQGYPWCSAPLMFSDKQFIPVFCRKASEYSLRQIKKMINSETAVPGNWYFLPNGMIWPGCYTSYKQAEKGFRSVGDFMFMLNNGNVDRSVNEEMMRDKPAIPDTEVKDRAESIAGEFFRRKGIRTCSAEERVGIARILRKELHCGYKQLTRVLRMKEEDLRRLV